MRVAIAKMQGTEAELCKDFESKLRSLEHDKEHYKKYYDWYFKAYHSNALKSYGGFHDAESAWTRLTNEIGDAR